MKIGMLFPDYGSQYVGMGKDLYDDSRLMQELFEEAYNCLSINFVKLCFASSDSELSALEHAYVSIFLMSVSLAALVKQEGIQVCAVAGHGIGELSALCSVDGISLPDGLYFLQKYALFYKELLQTASVHACVVKGISTLQLKRFCAEVSKDNLIISIAAYTSDYEHVVTGSAELFDALAQKVHEKKGVIEKSPVEAGLHSSLMDGVVATLEKYSEKIDFKDVGIPLIACADGALFNKGDLIKRRVMKQIHAPIAWKKVLQHCIDWDVIIEIGPGKTLTPLIRAMYPNKLIMTINSRADINELKKVVSEMSPQLL